MGRASSIDRLPADILGQLNGLLSDPRCSQHDAVQRINAILSEDGHRERVSKSAVNRYALRMNAVGQRLKERHQVAEMWVNKFGRLPQGKLGQIIIQMVHGMAYDASVKLAETDMEAEDMPAMVKMLKDLAVLMERSERAATLNAGREQAIRQQAAEDAASAAEKAAKQAGVSVETIERIRRDVLGMAA